MEKTDRTDMRVVFWWNIPCVGMINVLRSYCDEIDGEAVAITGELNSSRKAMGWKDDGKQFESHIIITDEQWDEKGREYLDKYSDRLHVFNGVTHPQRMQRLIEYAISRGIEFCNLTEAYYNLNDGYKKWIKEMYLRVFLPLRTGHIARKSLGAVCLSGGSERDLKQLHKAGFRRVYPFGYFTEEKRGGEYRRGDDGKIHLLCPGLLEPYKGVDVLIKAVKKIHDGGVRNFVCHITGNGSQRRKLSKMIEDLGVGESVVLEGVLDNDTYSALLSKIDILVAPGRVEPWGIRINEAIQRGNAVVMSDGLGAYRLIEESGGGSVFRSGSVQDLAEKLMPYLTDEVRLAEAKNRNKAFKDKISCRHQAHVLKGILEELKQV